MPLHYLSQLTDTSRTVRADVHMGVLLAAVAGALDAGGFLAVGQYTSHMTGMVSMLADQVVLHNVELAVVALVSWFAFLAGAACTAVVVNHSARQGVQNIYARPVLIEATCVLAFGSFGGTLRTHAFVDVSLAIIVLCFAMGLQTRSSPKSPTPRSAPPTSPA